MSHFGLLTDPEQYARRNADPIADAEARTHWLEHFAAQMDRLVQLSGDLRGQAAAPTLAKAREAYGRELDTLADTPLRPKDLSALREKILRAHRLIDPLSPVKQRWNVRAVEHYLPRVDELDALDAPERWTNLITGVLAAGLVGFHAGTHDPADGLPIERVPARPWLVDDYDRLAEALPVDNVSAWSKVVLFIDGAGADFVLGVMPLARDLALDGVRVVLAANETPALAAVTADEVIELAEQLAGLDADLRDLISADMFEVVSTGSRLETLDLCEVSDELNAAAADAELVALLGMNRGLGGNLDARFTCDCLRLCLLTDPAVAATVGGRAGDAFCQFTPAGD